jgi:hypothetical protein
MFTSQSRKSKSRPLLCSDRLDYTPYTRAEEVAEVGGFDARILRVTRFCSNSVLAVAALSRGY